MKKLLLLSLVVLSMACGRCIITPDVKITKDWRKFKTIDPEMIAYVESFELDFNIKIDNLVVGFDYDNLVVEGDSKAGYCEVKANLAQITINVKVWDNLKTNVHREQLMYHELGHCALRDFTHRDGKLKGGCPESIMNSRIFNDRAIRDCYIPRRGYYIEEMK